MASYAGRMQHLVLTAALIAFGCGGIQPETESGNGPTGEPPLTKRQIQLAASIIPDSLLTHINDTITFEMVHKECGHTVETIDSQAIQLNMIGPGTEIPEYHDCQRMIAKDDTTYAQLIALYATQQAQPTNPHPDSAYLLVQIMNYGPAEGSDAAPTYEPLGIPYGSSCLYGQLHAPKTRAWVLPLGARIDCLQRAFPISMLQLWGSLELRREVVPGATEFDYPNVARWDWDDPRNEQFIGVECGNAWCEIGRDGFTTSPTYGMGNGNIVVKGWYDVQRLAEMKNGKLVPGQAIGVLYPTPQLDQVEAEDFKGRTVYAANAYMVGRSNTYGRKYGISGNPGALMMLNISGANAPSGQWASIGVTTGGQSGPPTKVTYTQHPLTSLRLRGTARWRWLETDEAVWVSCINGCCQIDPN